MYIHMYVCMITFQDHTTTQSRKEKAKGYVCMYQGHKRAMKRIDRWSSSPWASNLVIECRQGSLANDK